MDSMSWTAPRVRMMPDKTLLDNLCAPDAVDGVQLQFKHSRKKGYEINNNFSLMVIGHVYCSRICFSSDLVTSYDHRNNSAVYTRLSL